MRDFIARCLLVIACIFLYLATKIGTDDFMEWSVDRLAAAWEKTNES